MDTLGRQLLVEFYRCNPDTLNDIDKIRFYLLKAADIINAKVIDGSFHRFSPQGVSGIVIIAESHLSIHTWPESQYAAIDIYTCGGLDPIPGCKFLASSFEAEDYRVVNILRGLPEDISVHANNLREDELLITSFPVYKVQFLN